MAIGKEEEVFSASIHVPVLGVNLHLVEIEFDEKIRTAKRAARVPRACAMYHANDVAAHLSAKVGEGMGGIGHGV